MSPTRIIIGITGASGAIYGKLLLERLAGLPDLCGEVAVIFSENARAVWRYELGEEPDPVGMAGWGDAVRVRSYDPSDFFAPPASGSAGYEAMIVCPCTMGTIGRIASGVSTDLLTRAADVMLKERRKLVLVPREAPFSLIHLNNMKLLTEAGAIICPASPSFYSRPGDLRELVLTVVDRVMTLAGVDVKGYRWGEEAG